MRADELHLRFASAGGRSQTFLPCCAPASLASGHPPSSNYEAFSSSLPFPFLFAPRLFTNRRLAFEKIPLASPLTPQSTIPHAQSRHIPPAARTLLRSKFALVFALTLFSQRVLFSVRALPIPVAIAAAPARQTTRRDRASVLNVFPGAFIDKSVTAPNSSSHIFFITIWRTWPAG